MANGQILSRSFNVVLGAVPVAASSVIPYDGPTTSVSIANTSTAQAIEYQVGGGAWQRLDGSGGVNLAVNLAADKVRLRRAALAGGDIKVVVTAERGFDSGLTQAWAPVGSSIMCLGDSITYTGCAPEGLPPNEAVRAYFPALVNLAPGGRPFFGAMWLSADHPTNGGTLRYYAADSTVTWQAAGDVEGPRIPVSADAMLYAFPSGNPASILYSQMTYRNRPAGDAADVLAAGGNVPILTSNTSSYGIVGWTLNLLGNSFAKSIVHAVSGCKASDIWAARKQWRDTYTDVTHIFLGTNDVISRPTALQALIDVENIIRERLAIGSKVVLGCLLPGDARNAEVNQAVAEFSMGLRDLGDKYGVRVWDAWPYLANLVGAWAVAEHSLDKTHPTAIATYIIAKRCIVPLLREYARPVPTVPAFALYHATQAPYGNLLANPTMSGTGGAKHASVSGTVPDSWMVNKDSAGTGTAVSTAPDSGGPALPDGRPGKYLSVSMNNANPGATDGEAFRVRPTNPVAANFAVGEYVVLEGEFTVSGSGLSAIQVLGDLRGGLTTLVLPIPGDATRPMGNLDGDTVPFKFKSKPLIIPAGTTTITVGIVVTLKTGGSAVLNVAPNFTLHKVPAPNL
jgi:hypothetical protein